VSIDWVHIQVEYEKKIRYWYLNLVDSSDIMSIVSSEEINKMKANTYETLSKTTTIKDQ